MTRTGTDDDAVAMATLPLSRSMGFLIREIHRMQSRILQDEIKNDGISSGGWYFLRVLWDEDGLTQRTLSLRIGVNEATTRTAIDRLEAAKLVVRIQDPSDRRKWIVRLTPRAQSLRDRLLGFAIDLNDQAMSGLSPQQAKDFVAHLQSVHGVLEQLSPNPDRRRRDPAAPPLG